MAETATPTLAGPSSVPIERTGPLAVNYFSADFTSDALAAELIAAPTKAGAAIYLTHVTMGIVANAANNLIVDASITLTDGAGSSAFGPIQLQADGLSAFSKDWKDPLKITDKKALDLTGAGAGGSYEAACLVYVEYFIGHNPLG